MSVSAAVGKFVVARLVSPDIVANGLVRNPNSLLKLGGNLTANGTSTTLNISSNADGVHLTETVANKIWLDTPTTVSAAFTAAGGFSTGSGNVTVGGNFSVVGSSSVNALTSSSTIQAASLVSTGASTLNSLAVTNAATAASLTATSSLVSNGTLAVSGASTLATASITSTLSVSGASALSALTASGATSLNSTLAVTGASTFTGVATVNNTLNVTGAGGINVTQGDVLIKAADIGYDTSSVGFEKLAIKLNGTTALQLFNSDQHLNVTGGVVTNSLTAQSGQPLNLYGSDSAGTVIVNGALQVKGTLTEVNKTTLNVSDLTINVAHSDSGAQADSAADTAGLVVDTGTSGYARSIQWRYNQGLAYKPASASAAATDDSLSFWEVKGGNLVLTRVIPAANHISYSYSTGAYAADNTQTTVSYRFAISDDEKLVVEKSAGANYAAGAGSNNTVQPVGSAAPVVAVFELPTSSTS